jgi:hypothetical protein
MNRIRTIAAAAITVLVIGSISQDIKGYATYSQWATLSVGMYVNPVNADVSESAATSALQTAMDDWNTQSGTAFRFNYAGRVSDTTTGYDNRNVILFRNESSGSTIASTYSWTSNGKLVDSDIVIWDGGFTFFTGTSGCTGGGAYIEDIATHELGHVMGLGHSADPTATMYPSYTACSQDLRTLAADDIAGAQSLYPPSTSSTNTAPSVSIASPTSGTSVVQGTALTFSGSASDSQDGSLTSKIAWSSSIDGSLGTGSGFSRTLSAGSHVITAVVTDSGGLSSVSAGVGHSQCNVPQYSPEREHYEPDVRCVGRAGSALTFSGSASDSQDGSLTSKIAWSSSLDGSLGTGSGFSKTLSVGSHVITAVVTDSGGLSASQQVSVTVSERINTGTAPAPTSSAPTLSDRLEKEGLQTTDLAWANLTGSSVDIYRNGSRIMTVGNTGRATDNINQRGGGSYSCTACDAGVELHESGERDFLTRFGVLGFRVLRFRSPSTSLCDAPCGHPQRRRCRRHRARCDAFPTGHDSGWICSNDLIGSVRHRYGSLGVVTEREARNAQNSRLLLDAA